MRKASLTEDVERDKRIKQIENKILEVTFDDLADGRYDHREILSALVGMFTFYTSLACADCRREIAKHLKKHVPFILEEANRVAADRDRDGGYCQTHH